MGTQEDRARVKQLLKKRLEDWQRERLIALKMGFESQNSLNRISEVINRNPMTIQRWFARYRKEGLDGLLKRNFVGNNRKLCDDEIQAYILKALKDARWNTAVQAQEDLQKHFCRSFNYKSVWVWLKKAAGVLRVPRPVHEKKDSQAGERFKEDFFQKLCNLPITSNKRVRVWFADESRYGLQPIQRRCWTLRGVRPHKKYCTKYDWSYCYGALDVVEGSCVFLQTPTVNLEWTEAFLKEIKKMYPDFEHIVVWDGAGFHPQNTEHPMVPEGVHVMRLPPYSPELNPIEQLWDLIQDQIANKLFKTIKRMDEVVAQHLSAWWTNPEQVLSLVGMNWQHVQANATAN